MDDHPDAWLTLTEAAARSGYTREAIRQRIRRHKLPASKGNDGQLRVRARDLADLPPLGLSTDDPGQTGDATTDAALAVLLATVDDLRTTVDDLRTTLVMTADKALVDHGRAERAEAQAVAEAARATMAEARADHAEEREAELRIQVERQGRELTASLLRTAIAETEAQALREALVEARRPAWRKWLGLP